MKLHTFDDFLTHGTAPAPKGDWRGVAIHPSSEVDLVDVGGYRLTVGSVVPWNAELAAVRRALGAFTYLDSAIHKSLDGLNVVGEKLVLAFFEQCDSLVPLGARAPTFRNLVTSDDNIPVALADSQLMLRVPMQGRSRAVVSFTRDEDLELTVTIVGRRMSPRSHGLEVSTFHAHDAETWRDGGVPPTLTDGNFAWKQLNIENERYDELLVYAYGAAGGTGSTSFSAESFGEGVNQ